jgi:hypothetical protein
MLVVKQEPALRAGLPRSNLTTNDQIRDGFGQSDLR